MRLRNWYEKFERPLSSLSLIGGFVFDALTLKRVDMFWENFWVVVHLLIVAGCIAVISFKENRRTNGADPAKIHFWLVNILQFFFGGLLSTFLVFYFRSATLAVSWPFLLVLFLAFAANESLKKHYARLGFQISLFYLSLFSSAIFIVPVITHRIGADIFLLSGGVSLILLGLFLFVLWFASKEHFRASWGIIFISVTAIFAATNILYFLGLIPPIPLSLKDAGLYHSLQKDADGNYIVTYEDQGPFSFFRQSQDVHVSPGEAIYAYSAIFSPASLNTGIIHEWQAYDTSRGTWITATRVDLSLIGGRDGGYRTYSMKNELTPGIWRVNVLTPRGEVIGRINFNVLLGYAQPILINDIKK